jgi:outer membrane receptor protein involved in Fe transport
MKPPQIRFVIPRLSLLVGLTAFSFIALPRLAAGGALSLLDLSFEELSQVEIKTDITSIRAKPIEEQPGIVSVVSAEQIRQTGARDLSDVLMQVPGFGLDTDVESMVGLTFRGLQGQEGKVLLIVNGMEVNEPLYGSLPILNHIPADAIKQVEIIRGPGSAQYGGDAGLAVVRVTTLDSSQNGGYAVLTPSFASGRVSESYAAGVGYSQGDWRWSSNFSYTSTTLSNRTYVALDGTTVDLTHAADMNPLFFDVGLGWRGLDVKVLYDRYRYDDLIDYGETVATPTETHFDSLLATAKYDLRVNESLRITPSFSYRSQTPWYANGAAGVYDVYAERYEGSLSAVADLTSEASLLVGAQWMRDSAYVNDSSFYGQDPLTYFYGSRSVAYVDVAGYAQYDWDAPWVNLSVGGRYERQDAVGGHFVPRFALTKAWGAWHIKALASQATRIPAINVLQEAVGQLKPEETTNYEIELGYKFAEKRSLTGNVFYMVVDRPIVFETLPGGDNAEGYFNGNRISSAGFETEYRWTQGQFDNFVGYSFYRAVNNDEPYVRGDSGRFLGAPTHKISASSTWHPTKQIDVNLSGYWLSSELAYTYPTDAITELSQQFMVNSYIDYRWGKASVGLGFSNLFDVKRYAPQPYNGGGAPIPLMGRTVFLKLGYRF